MNVVICNADHPEWGCATIPFPIPDEEYANCMELLKAMEIGGVLERDCYVDQIIDAPPILDMLEGAKINIDELDFLARSIDRYTDEEMAKFQSMAAAKGYTDMTDLINLSFCCEQTTVITDFSNLESLGKSHYLATHGGCAPVDVYDALNGEGIARELIASGEGQVTPYGVVYDNGMKMEQVYKGQEFPPYCYKPKALDVEVEAFGGDGSLTFLQLPMPTLQMERMLQRGGMGINDDCNINIEAASCPAEVFDVIKYNYLPGGQTDDLRELNSMCRTIYALTPKEQLKLAAAVKFVGPEYPFQIQHLAENLDCFDFVPGVKTAEEYGRWMIEESGHFEYDPNLDEYYDFEKYGNEHISRQEGQFNELGYISYHGTLSFEELVMRDPTEQGQTMGGA